MNTLYFLMAEFETVTPALSEISKKYLGLEPRTAEDKAAVGKLPLPTFRICGSQKAPRLVHLDDLAAYIDKARREAKEQYEKFHGK